MSEMRVMTGSPEPEGSWRARAATVGDVPVIDTTLSVSHLHGATLTGTCRVGALNIDDTQPYLCTVVANDLRWTFQGQVRKYPDQLVPGSGELAAVRVESTGPVGTEPMS